jgi:XRE family transcriptional regulator, regulator of sulfur utilization
VRALRAARGLSLRELAERSGVSAPMLSQVERGETSPTLAVADKIADGLGLSLSQLLRLDEAAPFAVVRPRDRRRGGDRRHRFQLLTPDTPGQPLAVSRHELAPGQATGSEPMHRAGAREFALVEQGSVTLEIDGAGHPLETGDAVTFDADLPHRFRAGGEPAIILSVRTTALRRS